MFRPLLLSVAFALSSGCVTSRVGSLPAPIATQFAAFNAHDPVALAKNVTEDFTFYLVDGDKMSVEVRGREELKTGITDYFGSYPTVRSEAVGQIPQGSYIAVRERVRWTDAKGDHVQEALSVYELKGGLIRAVWYFPAEKNVSP